LEEGLVTKSNICSFAAAIAAGAVVEGLVSVRLTKMESLLYPGQERPALSHLEHVGL
jgi:hypothetical protein